MTEDVRWKGITRGDPIPDDAVQAGTTSTDGEVWVGRSAGEPGKINTEKHHMHNFWAHSTRMWDKVVAVEILCITGNRYWLSIQRGQPIPDGAVSAGITKDDGLCYVGRFNGEAGKINIDKDSKMYNFWGHEKGGHQCAEILVAGDRKSPALPDSAFASFTLAAGAPKVMAAAGGYSAVEKSLPVAVADGCLPLKLLQFNIWNEGNEIADQWNQTVNVCATVQADIITFSEVRNWHGSSMERDATKDFHERIKTELLEKGLHYEGCMADGGDVGLISRFPIDRVEQVTTALRSTITAYHLRGPGDRKMCVCSAHLDWKQYALNQVRGYDGNTFMKCHFSGASSDLEAIKAMDEASGRGQSIRDFISFAKGLTKDTAIILAGDFNECSHLDWTEATKDLFGHNGLVIPWTHSKDLETAGFQDSWRHLFPDPVTHLGATWPSTCSDGGKCTSWAKDSDERDRIDFVYHNSAGIRPKEAFLVGPEFYYVHAKRQPAESQGPFLEETKCIPWPSDHKALLVNFEMDCAGLQDERHVQA